MIVVIAILGILAAIAVPRFTGMRHEATVKAEASTATSIISAARVQEATTGNAVTAGNVNNTSTTEGFIDKNYMIAPSAPTYAISGGGASNYVIKWTSAAKGYGSQTLTEGTAFGAVVTTP